MIKHILFDCDGVLIDTEIVAAEVVTDWLNSENVAIDIEEFIQKYTGKTFTDIITSLKDSERLSPKLDVSAVVPILDKKIRDNQRPIHGVSGMLKALTTPCSVVSNSAKDYVELALNKLDISHHFQGRVFSAEMVKRGKPSPEVYLLAVDTLQISPDEVLVVEDSVAGVKAAVSASLKVIGYLGGSHVREGLEGRLLETGAYMTVANHTELTSVLTKK